MGEGIETGFVEEETGFGLESISQRWFSKILIQVSLEESCV